MKKLDALKKYSLFKIISLVSIAVLLIVIAIQIGIMINLKEKIKKVSEENQSISSTFEENQCFKIIS